METNKFILYPSNDGKPEIRLRVEDGTVWLSQAEIAALFGTSVANVNIHIRNVLREGEPLEPATINDCLIVRAEGSRQAERKVNLYRLETGHAAAEIVVKRADPAQPNMNLQAWSGSRVRKHDVISAKNYLSHDEIDTLNRLLVAFLEQAELRVKDRKQPTLGYWRSHVDRMLEFNDRPASGNRASGRRRPAEHLREKGRCAKASIASFESEPIAARSTMGANLEELGV